MDINTFLGHFTSLFTDTDPSLIKADTNFRDLEEWSSLIALSIIAMADDEYGVNLKGDDVKKSNTPNDIFEIIKSKKS